MTNSDCKEQNTSTIQTVDINFLSHKVVSKSMRDYPLFLDPEDEMHILAFRKILEASLSQGRWWGEVPRIS